MGILRTLLAICVVVFHSYKIAGLGFTGGKVSVQCFYIISGFYMALILNEKYTGENYSYWNFIKGRFLRIFPSYLIVLVISFFFSLVGFYFWNNPYYFGLYIPYWEKLSLWARLWFITENFLVIGQDLLFFFKLNVQHLSLEFTSKAFITNKPLILNGFLFLPQAWTLSLELTFYMLAPFIVRSRFLIQASLIAISLGLRYYFYTYLHLNHDPWTYRFFPFEIAFFVTGICMFNLYKIYERAKVSNMIGLISLILVIILIIFYDKLPFHENVRCWYFYLIFSITLPVIFQITKTIQMDRFIGELSFPIYLLHHLIMFILKKYFWTHTENMYWFGISSVLLSIITALLFYQFISKPLEKLRVRTLNYSK